MMLGLGLDFSESLSTDLVSFLPLWAYCSTLTYEAQKKVLIFIYDLCVCARIRKSEDNLWVCQFSPFSSREFWGLNLDCQDWQQVLLPLNHLAILKLGFSCLFWRAVLIIIHWQYGWSVVDCAMVFLDSCRFSFHMACEVTSPIRLLVSGAQ